MKHFEITRTMYTIADFVAWQKSGTLALSPSFQRRPVWKPDAKSFFIDTILRGLPVPIMFLRDKATDMKTLLSMREVVDGQQRIRTVLSYVAPSLLSDFKAATDLFTIKKVHNEALADKGFDALPVADQRRILDYQFSVHVLPSSLDDRDVLQIFARMNATGVKLNHQELRNAEYFGEFKTLCFDLAAEQLDAWRKWKIFTEFEIARMNEVEFTSEFLIFMLTGNIAGKNQAAIRKYYKDLDRKFPQKTEISRRFRHVMSVIDAEFGTKLATTGSRGRAIFYALFASVYTLSYGSEKLAETRRQPTAISGKDLARIRECEINIADRTAPNPVLTALSQAVTNLSSRKTVHNYFLGRRPK